MTDAAEPMPVAVPREGHPLASWAAIGVLVAAHVAQGAWALRVGLVDDGRAAWWGQRSEGMRVLLGGRTASLVDAGGWWRLASTGLVHVEAFHLFVNALAIALVGRVVERWLGPWRVASALVAGAVGGACVAQLSRIPQSDGASGAAFGLLGAGIATGLRTPGLPDHDRRMLVRVMGAVALVNVALSLVAPSLDAASHVGGLTAGFGLGALAVGSRRGWTWGLPVAAWALVVVLGYGGLLGP